MIRLGVSDILGPDEKFGRYTSWLQSGGAGAECVKLSPLLRNADELSGCDALVLTGGHDVDPARYGGPPSHPAIVDVNRERDDFELQLLTAAETLRLPLLGICRGMQLTNVYYGGTLIPDIAEAGYAPHKGKGEVVAMHPVTVSGGSSFARIASGGVVNSSHHQAVLTPGKGLRVAALSGDGIIEALEEEAPGRFPFLLLVQWHPERMAASDPLASGVLHAFLNSIQSTHSQKITI
jgi:putative glutamine amidotransferase